MMLRSFGQVNGTMLRLGMRTSSVFNSQHQSTLICPFHCCVSIIKVDYGQELSANPSGLFGESPHSSIIFATYLIYMAL